MPIHEYILPDGTRTERLFFPGEFIPSEIEVDGQKAHRTISRTVVRFRGAFSGGTRPAHMTFADDGSVNEAGRDRDIKRRRRELDAKRDKERKEFVAAQVAELTL